MGRLGKEDRSKVATEKWQRKAAREAIRAAMKKVGDNAGLADDEVKKIAEETIGRKLEGLEFGQVVWAGFRHDKKLGRYFIKGYYPEKVHEARVRAKNPVTSKPKAARRAKPKKAETSNPQPMDESDPAFDLTGDYRVEVEGAGVNLQGLKVRRVIIWLAALFAFALVAIAMT